MPRCAKINNLKKCPKKLSKCNVFVIQGWGTLNVSTLKSGTGKLVQPNSLYLAYPTLEGTHFP